MSERVNEWVSEWLSEWTHSSIYIDIPRILEVLSEHTYPKTMTENNSTLGKVRFIKVNELKLTQVELFLFFPILCAAANASELFWMAHLANIERFLYYSNL